MAEEAFTSALAAMNTTCRYDSTGSKLLEDPDGFIACVCQYSSVMCQVRSIYISRYLCFKSA